MEAGTLGVNWRAMADTHTLVLEVNRPDVIDEVFDGEAVLVNLRTGRYYALDRAASGVWERLVSAEPLEAIASALAARHGLSTEQIESGLVPFLRRLADESLIRGVDALELSPDAGDEDLPFAPSLQLFTDMEDLLLLDPIHEIDLDGSGWPTAPAAD